MVFVLTGCLMDGYILMKRCSIHPVIEQVQHNVLITLRWLFIDTITYITIEVSQYGTQYHQCAALGDFGRPDFVDRVCDTNVLGRYVRLRRVGHMMNFCEVQIYAYPYEGEWSRFVWFHHVNHPNIMFVVCHFVTPINTLWTVFCTVTTFLLLCTFCILQGSFWAWARPMRECVTK